MNHKLAKTTQKVTQTQDTIPLGQQTTQISNEDDNSDKEEEIENLTETQEDRFKLSSHKKWNNKKKVRRPNEMNDNEEQVKIATNTICEHFQRG